MIRVASLVLLRHEETWELVTIKLQTALTSTRVCLSALGSQIVQCLRVKSVNRKISQASCISFFLYMHNECTATSSLHLGIEICDTLKSHSIVRQKDWKSWILKVPSNGMFKSTINILPGTVKGKWKLSRIEHQFLIMSRTSLISLLTCSLCRGRET